MNEDIYDTYIPNPIHAKRIFYAIYSLQQIYNQMSLNNNLNPTLPNNHNQTLIKFSYTNQTYNKSNPNLS